MHSFSLDDACPFLRCPKSGSALARKGDAVLSESGERYPIVDGIVDLGVAPTAAAPGVSTSYDRTAGLAYNAWIFNPVAMSLSWGLGVLRVPLLLRPAQALPSGLALEVPCGTGIFTANAYRQRPDTRVLAVDYSMGMLRAARDRGRGIGVCNAVYVRADVARLPIANSVLDGCISLAGFHAFPEPERAASEIARAMKPGARLSTSIACSGVRRISDAVIERVMKPQGFFSQGLSPDRYRAMLEQAGFDVESVVMAGAVMVARSRRRAPNST